MADHNTAVRVANAELTTVREAMRELNRLVDALERGELEKVVLTQRNRMRAVVVSLERFSELERQARLNRRLAA
jgi:prevent-host-death family protein